MRQQISLRVLLCITLTCDSLPFRTVFHKSNCYFVIDADRNSSTSCARVLPGAKQVGEAPDPVWTAVDFPENEFVRDGDSSGKKRAMCLVENRFPGLRNSTTPRANKCKRENICSTTKSKIDYLLPIPYVSQLKETIEPGRTFIVRGHTAPSPTHWSINFHSKAGVFASYDIPLHFSVRHDLGFVRLTSFINGNWLGDARDEKHPIPNSLRNKDFEIRIVAHKDHFQFFINNEEFCTYKYNMVLASITHFTIWNTNSYNDVRPYYVKLGANYDPVPMESGITSTGFTFCKTIYVTGVVLPHMPLAAINLWRGPKDFGKVFGDTEFVLHWLLTFNNNQLLMNDYRNGYWSPGQTMPVPFLRGTPFNVTIVNDPTGFVIWVNEKYHATFAHRVCPNNILSIHIDQIADATVRVSNAANCEAPKENTGICANRG